MERDVHTLRLTRCVFSLLLCLKPYCLICTIGYTERNWCHIVATTTRKISTQFFESESLSETCQPSTKTTTSRISTDFLIQRKSARVPSFLQKAVISYKNYYKRTLYFGVQNRQSYFSASSQYVKIRTCRDRCTAFCHASRYYREIDGNIS